VVLNVQITITRDIFKASQVFVDSVRNGNVDDDGPVGGHVVEVAQRGVDEDGTAVGSDSVT